VQTHEWNRHATECVRHPQCVNRVVEAWYPGKTRNSIYTKHKNRNGEIKNAGFFSLHVATHKTKFCGREYIKKACAIRTTCARCKSCRIESLESRKANNAPPSQTIQKGPIPFSRFSTLDSYRRYEQRHCCL
jgi:hypothetical protein